MLSEMNNIQAELLKKERLKVLQELALLDDGFETIYDNFALVASKALGTPVALVSMVGADYQFFKAHTGLPEPWKSRRSTPLSHAFCKHVVANHAPLIVTDARQHELVKDNLAIPDLNVIGYLGMPIELRDGRTLGSFCVIDGEPHAWSDTEIEVVRELSEILSYEIDLKAQVNLDPGLQPKLDAAHEAINGLIDSLDTDLPLNEFLKQLQAARDYFQV